MLGSALLGSALLGLVMLGVGAPSAAAQSEVADAGAAVVHTSIERPPEGSMRRGAVAVPAWAIWAGASVVVLGAALGLGYRLRRSKR